MEILDFLVAAIAALGFAAAVVAFIVASEARAGIRTLRRQLGIGAPNSGDRPYDRRPSPPYDVARRRITKEEIDLLRGTTFPPSDGDEEDPPPYVIERR